MKCKTHPNDPSTGVGVCSSCLRHRLFVLIAAQSHAHSQANDPLPHPQLQFPPSVSPPLVLHRKSSCDHPLQLRRRFFSTPQVGPTFSNNPIDFLPENKPPKFSLLGLLFRKRSDPTSQPSIFDLWRKKQSRASSVTDSAVSGSACRRKRSVVVSNRGMSPAGGSDEDEDRSSPSDFAYSSDDCPRSWRKAPTPSATFVTPRRVTSTPHHPRSRSGFAFCLSPLVRNRMSPVGSWKNKGGMAGEAGYSGNLSDAAAPFCKNRSRKLADFGRGRR